MAEGERHRYSGITVRERWGWTRTRAAEERRAIADLLKPMNGCPMKPLPGDVVDPETGALKEKRTGP